MNGYEATSVLYRCICIIIPGYGQRTWWRNRWYDFVTKDILSLSIMEKPIFLNCKLFSEQKYQNVDIYFKISCVIFWKKKGIK